RKLSGRPTLEDRRASASTCFGAPCAGINTAPTASTPTSAAAPNARMDRAPCQFLLSGLNLNARAVLEVVEIQAVAGQQYFIGRLHPGEQVLVVSRYQQ